MIRYVGLDLLFASSPLYPPYFTADRVPGRVDLDVNTIEGWQGVNASGALHHTQPVPAGAERAAVGLHAGQRRPDLAFTGRLPPLLRRSGSRSSPASAATPTTRRTPTCSWRPRSTSLRFLDGEPDYEAGLINYAVGDPDLDPGILGYADDNWLDGTQSGVFSFIYPAAVGLPTG